MFQALGRCTHVACSVDGTRHSADSARSTSRRGPVRSQFFGQNEARFHSIFNAVRLTRVVPLHERRTGPSFAEGPARRSGLLELVGDLVEAGLDAGFILVAAGS